MRTNKRIRTVLYGDERLSAAELEVIHTPAMQRLYSLKQLGLADRVYIDASHSRIHHVVGVLEQTDKLVDAIIINLRQRSRVFHLGLPKDNIPVQHSGPLSQFVSRRKPVIRFVGLLHDLTHAPFGHTVEDEIRIVESKHDHPERQAVAFLRLLCQLIAWLTLEAYGTDAWRFPADLKPFLSESTSGQKAPLSAIGLAARKLVSPGNDPKSRLGPRIAPRQIAEMLAHLACAMTALLHLEALHQEKLDPAHLPEPSGYAFQRVVRDALIGTEHESLLDEFQFLAQRDAFMLDIVGNTVCADLLDYASRDSHYAALRLDFDPDRIAENFTLVSVDARRYAIKHNEPVKHYPEGTDPFEGACLRTAISLVSHKYRTDIPSELMNLLNVRFYIYERVIFHPTKSAAGSMLGTALQLLGWRRSTAWSFAGLPDHLRFVGDDVFLHDVRSALDFATQWLADLGDDHTITTADLASIKNLEHVHSGVALDILSLRVTQNSGDVREELSAAQLLLNRLASRRYFRPVYRAKPSLEDDKNADLIADWFQNPDRRYEAEREIEVAAHLPLGTITIHCPTRRAARKIANVFLTKPDFAADGAVIDRVHKLRHIASLDEEIFQYHQEAVKAVEEMYGSMWRLNVYAAPEHLDQHERIAEAASRVIFEKLRSDNEFADPKLLIDPNLKIELDPGSITRGIGTVDGDQLGPLGETLGHICEEVIEPKELPTIPPELFGPADRVPHELRERIKSALAGAFAGPIEARERETAVPSPVSEKAAEGVTARRADEILVLVKSYLKRTDGAEMEAFQTEYQSRFDRLAEWEFNEFHSNLSLAIENQKRRDALDATHRGWKLHDMREAVNELLDKYGRDPRRESQRMTHG